MVMPLCVWLLVFPVSLLGISGSLLVFVDGHTCNALQGGAHAGHEAGVVGWPVTGDESCEEGGGHVERCEVLSDLRVASVSDDI